MKLTIDTKTAKLQLHGSTRPRGSHSHDAYKDNQFPKGKSGNPGGKPKVIQRFKTMFMEELMKPAPKEVCKAVGFKRAVSNYQVLIAAQVRAAQTGDVGASREIRETIEGKTPIITRNVSLTVAMEAYAHDPEFQVFMNEQYSSYLKKGGQPFEATDTTGGFLSAAPAGQSEDDGTAD
jgi:hypothetical protein